MLCIINDSEDQDEHDDTEPNRIHQFKEVDVDLIMEEMGIHESLLHSSISIKDCNKRIRRHAASSSAKLTH